MECENLFKENTDLNIVKSWLIGSTDGQTYSINDWFLADIEFDKVVNGNCIVGGGRVDNPDDDVSYYAYDFANIEMEWDEIIGFKYGYKIDDPELNSIASSIAKKLREFTADLIHNPEKHFKCIRPAKNKAKEKFYWECESNDGYFESSLKDHHKSFDTQEECYEDMRQEAIAKMFWNTEWDDVADGLNLEADKDGIVHYDSPVGYEILFYTDHIVHESYSGKYTYTIKRAKVFPEGPIDIRSQI